MCSSLLPVDTTKPQMEIATARRAIADMFDNRFPRPSILCQGFSSESRVLTRCYALATPASVQCAPASLCNDAAREVARSTGTSAIRKLGPVSKRKGVEPLPIELFAFPLFPFTYRSRFSAFLDVERALRDANGVEGKWARPSDIGGKQRDKGTRKRDNGYLSDRSFDR